MSYEIASAASSTLVRGSGTLGHIQMMWVRLLEYIENNDFFLYNSGTVNDNGVLAEASSGLVRATSQGGINDTITTSSNETWVFICLVYQVGTGETIYYRHEGQTVLNVLTPTDSGMQGIGNITIGATFGPANHKRITAYKEWSGTTSLTAAQILAESTQNAPVVTAGLTNWLQCDAGHTVGVDQSAAAQNWTVSGTTITTNADEPNMSAALYVQAASGNLGNGGSGTVTFAGAQTAGNTNVLAVWYDNEALSTAVSVPTDSAGNAYVLSGFMDPVHGTGGVTLYLFTCVGIKAHAAGNVVSFAWTGVEFVDAMIVEYPPTGAVATTNGANRFGGGATTLNTTLSGTVAGELVVMFGMSQNGTANVQTTVGAVGANAANIVVFPSGDNTAVQDGLSDGSSPMTVFVGSGTDDYFTVVAIAFLPPGRPYPNSFRVCPNTRILA